VPTIQCSRCHKWHHQPCVANLKFTSQRFMCPDCGPLVLEDYQESELASAPQRATQSNGMFSRSPPTIVGEKNPNDGDEERVIKKRRVELKRAIFKELLDEDDKDLEYSPTKLHVPQKLYEYEGSIYTRSLSPSLSLESVFEREELSTAIDNEDEVLDEDMRSRSAKRRRKRGNRIGKSAGVEPLITDGTLATLAVASQSLAREISLAASKSNRHLSDRSLIKDDEDLEYFPTELYTPQKRPLYEASNSITVPRQRPPTTRKSGPFVTWLNRQIGSVAPVGSRRQ